MSERPRLLDMMCGAGGASVGYHRAGFEVVGVDIKPQKNYPFAFIKGDAIAYCRDHGHEFDAIHASPPCQAFTPLKALHPSKHDDWPDLVAATRDSLTSTGRPWAIENVVQAPLVSGIFLCGTMFGLRTYRHRWFELSHFMFQPQHPSVTGNRGQYVSSRALDIDWMTGAELLKQFPPAYTQLIGTHLLAHIAPN